GSRTAPAGDGAHSTTTRHPARSGPRMPPRGHLRETTPSAVLHATPMWSPATTSLRRTAGGELRRSARRGSLLQHSRHPFAALGHLRPGAALNCLGVPQGSRSAADIVPPCAVP